jgi:hypothetical protein
VVRAQGFFERKAAEVSGRFSGQGSFNVYLAAVEELINELEPLVTAAAPLTGAVGYLATLAFKVVSFFVNYNYQPVALFASTVFRAALFIFSKAFSTASFILYVTFYPRLLLKFLFFVAMAAIMSAMWKFFMISIFISFKLYLIWLPLVGLSYIWIYTAKQGYTDKRLSEGAKPESLDEHVPAPINVYGVAFVSLLPITINLIFGLPTLLPM